MADVDRSVAVIGSGFGGLAAAIRLQAAGARTVLFEARDRPGGRAYVYQDEGFTFDAGPTVITAPHCLEELFEVVTWAQLGLHQKPLGILNVNGFYDPLIAQLDHMVRSGLLKRENRELIMIDLAVDGLLVKMEAFQPLPEKKWISDLDQV